jgi:carbonic anhydrase/acetyltransferase-like protein (isoleucine patch superfamily)
MKYTIHSLGTVLALLIVTMVVTIGAGSSISAHAATEKKPAQTGKPVEKKVKIRKEKDLSLKKEEQLYPQLAISLAQRYRVTAEIVAQQGGDHKPLLEAAAYYENEAE